MHRVLICALVCVHVSMSPVERLEGQVSLDCMQQHTVAYGSFLTALLTHGVAAKDPGLQCVMIPHLLSDRTMQHALSAIWKG